MFAKVLFAPSLISKESKQEQNIIMISHDSGFITPVRSEHKVQRQDGGSVEQSY